MENFDGTLTMEISDSMLINIKRVFEIEILQGTSYKLQNGMNFIEIQVTGEKGEAVLTWIKSMCSKPDVDFKINGLPVSKN